MNQEEMFNWQKICPFCLIELESLVDFSSHLLGKELYVVSKTTIDALIKKYKIENNSYILLFDCLNKNCHNAYNFRARFLLNNNILSNFSIVRESYLFDSNFINTDFNTKITSLSLNLFSNGSSIVQIPIIPLDRKSPEVTLDKIRKMIVFI